MIGVLLAAILGVLAGVITGMIPGLHVCPFLLEKESGKVAQRKLLFRSYAAKIKRGWRI